MIFIDFFSAGKLQSRREWGGIFKKYDNQEYSTWVNCSFRNEDEIKRFPDK